MTYIPPTTKKDAFQRQKDTRVIEKVVVALAIIFLAMGLIKSDWAYLWVALVLLVPLPIFRFVDWMEYNNAKQIEETDDRSKKL